MLEKTAPKAVDKIREFYQSGMTQGDIADQLNTLRKTDKTGYGKTKWTKVKVSSLAVRNGLRSPLKHGGTKKRTWTRRAKTSFVDLPMATTKAGKIAIVICGTDQIKHILEELT